MVTFVASFIGAAAVFARVTSAVPMMMESSMKMEPSMMMESSSSSAPPPMMTSASSMYGNKYGSGSSYGYGSGSSDASSSSSAPPPAYTMSSSSSYGSGSSNWNSGGYDSCVQQCVAKFGTPSSMMMPPSSTSSSGSTGTGATHTVIVAPTQGVLRYVPFALNASVGDTIMFMWGANNHTVTKSSELTPCNKTSDSLFASGTQNKSFVFTQVVNDTNPTFYYCGTPTHCQKGMFGIINPPNAYMQPSSAAMMMPSLADKYPSTKAGMSYAANVTANKPAAAGWGDNIDLSGVPEWAQSYTAENIAFTKSLLAMNPELVNDAGSVDLTPLGGTPLMLPTDVASAVRANGDGSYGSPPGSSTAASSAATPTSSTSSDSSKALSNGAGAVASPRVAVALVAIVAAFFAL